MFGSLMGMNRIVMMYSIQFPPKHRKLFSSPGLQINE